MTGDQIAFALAVLSVLIFGFALVWDHYHFHKKGK